MRRFVDNKKTVLAITVAMLLLAVVIPTCRMIGCSMDMGSADMAGMMHSPLASFTANCEGEWLASTGILATLGESTMLLALFAIAFVAVFQLMAPQAAVRQVRIVDRAPPPPPDDPWGERFRL